MSGVNSGLYNQGLSIQIEGKLPVVVMKSGEKYVAFLVDELVDEREIVVKRLNLMLSRIEWVAGTTVLGDSSIVVILDGPALLNRARARINRLRASGQSSGVAASWRQEITHPRKSLLVVDDSVTTRELERSILEAAGYKVDVAVDGVEALEMLAKRKYALAIVDVEMPRMDGFTLTAHLKGNAETSAMPIIIVSSLSNEAYKRRGIEVGAQAYITKGQFDQNNLLDTIELLASR
jgi:two-component system chemotaxis sensor kinase CheA